MFAGPLSSLSFVMRYAPSSYSIFSHIALNGMEYINGSFMLCHYSVTFSWLWLNCFYRGRRFVSFFRLLQVWHHKHHKTLAWWTQAVSPHFCCLQLYYIISSIKFKKISKGKWKGFGRGNSLHLHKYTSMSISGKSINIDFIVEHFRLEHSRLFPLRFGSWFKKWIP